MNKAERAKFIIDLVNNVKKDLLKENSKYPNNWDGHELRFRIADAFSDVVMHNVTTKKRIKDYKNFCLVNGLI